MKFPRSASAISLLLMALSMPDPARSTEPEIAENQTAESFNLLALRGLCSVVFDRSEVTQPSQFRFRYEQKFFEAAGVSDRNVDDPAAHERIRKMWLEYPEKFTCNSSDFDVEGGSILKYAISTRNFNFFATAIEIWRIDPNQIDAYDGRTLLDYLDVQIIRNRGTPVESELVRFARRLRRLGGLTALEVRASQ